jgi:GNAT superfamily N-acetyltransferase
VALRPDTADTLTIRPIRADDSERLRAHHERLSPESRYRRFLSAKPALTSADVRYLVDVDGCDHHALVATTAAPDGAEEFVGVARYIRFPERREVAEVAIVVVDGHQHRGIGSQLVARLAEQAVARGVRRFRATMLADNFAVQRLFESLAEGPVERRRLGSLVEMDFGLPGAEHAAADCGASLAAA